MNGNPVRALVFTQVGQVELREVELDPIDDGEVGLEVAAAGICGSELEGVRTPNPMRTPPLVMGHEMVGRRDDGQLVAVNPLLSCGRCDLCVEGATNLCRERQLIGVHRPGGFAERVNVPVGSVRPLPDGVALDSAVLAEPLANGVHALRRAERQLGRPPRSVGVIGAGMIGVACALAAVDRGATEVAIADLSDERLALAGRTLPVTTGRALEGEFEATIDAVGLSATRAAAVDRLRPGGVSVWIGLEDSEPGFESRALVRQERVVCGTFAYLDEDFDAALELCAKADPDWIERVPLEAAADRFHELMQGPGSVPKTIVVPAA